MCPNQRVAISGQLLLYRTLNQTVCCRIAFLLFCEAHSTQHSQAIRVERHHRVRAGEQEYFFRAGIADAGKPLQGFFRLRERLLESRPQVAVEFFIRDFRNGDEFFRAYVREYASLAE